MPIHLLREIEFLKKKILELSAMVEECLSRAIRSVERRDGPLAREVIEGDFKIDRMEVDVEEECLKILALHQPVAVDLRFIVAVLKINNDLERIADLAVNIAERGLFLIERENVIIPFDLHAMAEKVKWMLAQSLNALVNLDGELARKVCAKDDEVDALNRKTYERVTEAIRKEPENLEALIQFLSISRYLERIGDHATNVAEDVVYMIEGEIVRHRDGKDTPA